MKAILDLFSKISISAQVQQSSILGLFQYTDFFGLKLYKQRRNQISLISIVK